MYMKKSTLKYMIASVSLIFFITAGLSKQVPAEEMPEPVEEMMHPELVGGGYAVTGQMENSGYTAKIYDAANGLLTSDANYILGSRDGYVWIGSYSGIIKYDGTSFDRLDTGDGLTNGRGLFEDSKGRIWVGTNDNGVVVISGEKSLHLTYKDGLPSSSIRIFEEDREGNIYIGTTSGVCYVDNDMNIHIIDDTRINNERVLKLNADKNGRIFGQTKSGIVFAIDHKKISELYYGVSLGIGNITTILADPRKSNEVYLCTDKNIIYRGKFGARAKDLKQIKVAPLENTHWISYDCGRVWLASNHVIGYLDENDQFHEVDDLPMNSGIEMMTSDYQGNMWFASSTQGVMKVVENSFVNMAQVNDQLDEVTNATCVIDDNLYIGTDKGLRILNRKGWVLNNRLTRYIGGARVRCFTVDGKGNLWISTFTNDLGLICYSKNGGITSYTVDDGMPGNEIRCTAEASDGSIIVGTNAGLAIIQNGKVAKTLNARNGVLNTVILTVAEGENGEIYAGSDGDGIYIIEDADIKKIGRDDGLTSDVIIRIKKDEKRGLYWIVTSNSIQYMKDGVINEVTSFPYNNNYDVFWSDDSEDMWIISSYGVYVVNVEDMLNDAVGEYRLYTVANGVTSTPTANGYSYLDDEGNLFIAGRAGVCGVNIHNFFKEKVMVKAAIKNVQIDDKKIMPDKYGKYVIPSSAWRVKITASVMDYSLANPTVRIFMEGEENDGIEVKRDLLPPLEYTGMKYGEHILHIQILDSDEKKIVLDNVFTIVKEPKLSELLLVRVLLFLFTAMAAGFIVWHIMKNTVISRQLEEIRQAKEEAERANTAKTRFLANMSHEIRTPINTIMGMNEMIMREDAKDVPKGYFMSMMNYAFDIKNATETLLGLINDLLDMSKIESGKMHVVEQEYDLAEMLRSIVSMIRVKSIEKDLMFDVVVDEILPVRMYGDAGKIKQIVLNLLTNAVKYTEKGGFVLSVSIKERIDEKITLSFLVKDTGIGVKEEDMEKLFTAYERLDEEKNSAIQGTGLGLDISRKFAELMGGSLVCRSVYGEGSEFELTIDQRIIDSTPIGLFSEHEDNSEKGPYVPKFIAPDADVLVVDDNPMNLNVIRSLLKATRIFITTASSGEECLEKMKSTRFNVVLLDHMMPGMDGIETVARIREKDPDIPVYALTANVTSGEDFYIQKGFTGYLAKPVDSLALEKAIMKHLPEEMMLKPEKAEEEEEIQEIPEELKWIYDVEDIDVEEGITNSGGVPSYIFSLKLFLETIDGNSKIISDSYEAGDIRLYTIKVHALKSSARIIGAKGLSVLAAELEDAGNKNDMEFIDKNTDQLLSDYTAYKEKLRRLSNPESSDEGKEMIPEDVLEDAYGALRDVIPQMDYDSVEMILEQLREYRLPDEEKERVGKLEKSLKLFDWSGMEELMK